MNVIAHGVDMVDCNRLAQSLDDHGRRFIQRVYTPAEQEYCQSRKYPVPHYAGRFAAKEAVLKVLGTGWRDGIAWTDIEVRNAPSGEPKVTLTGRCREVAEQKGLVSILLSISHIDSHAIASAIGLGPGEPPPLGLRE